MSEIKMCPRKPTQFGTPEKPLRYLYRRGNKEEVVMHVWKTLDGTAVACENGLSVGKSLSSYDNEWSTEPITVVSEPEPPLPEVRRGWATLKANGTRVAFFEIPYSPSRPFCANDLWYAKSELTDIKYADEQPQPDLSLLDLFPPCGVCEYDGRSCHFWVGRGLVGVNKYRVFYTDIESVWLKPTDIKNVRWLKAPADA